jgi:hypothetical protein
MASERKTRPKKCWIVEVHVPTRGWEPCYRSEVNATRAWATENRDKLAKLFKGEKYRVRQYQQVGLKGRQE